MFPGLTFFTQELKIKTLFLICFLVIRESQRKIHPSPLNRHVS